MTCDVRGAQAGRRVLGVAVAFTLALASVGSAGCAIAPDVSGGDATETTSDAPQDATDERIDGEVTASELEGSQAADEQASNDVFDEAYVDRYGDPTISALTELKGSQLSTLLREQGFVWSARELHWMKEDGSAALAVRGVDGENLKEEQVLRLGMGCKTKKASYRLVTSHYSSLERAFNALSSSNMICEDSTYTEGAGVAVVQGPSGGRSLVLMSVDEGVFVFSVFSEPAIKAGSLDEVTGLSLGDTIDDAFLVLAGRKPVIEQQ